MMGSTSVIPLAFANCQQDYPLLHLVINLPFLSTRIYQDLSRNKTHKELKSFVTRIASLFQKLCISNNLQK